MTNHRIVMTLFICLGLTSLYASQYEALAEEDIRVTRRTERHAGDDITVTRETASHIATVKYRDGDRTTTITSFQEGISYPQVIGLFIKVNRDMNTIVAPPPLNTSNASSREADHTYGTFKRPAAAGAEESSNPQPKCCLFWYIPTCFSNCLKRLCCR